MLLSGSTVVRFGRLLPLALWVGGLVFLAFILAPFAFHTLSTHEAGVVVGGTLRILHGMGLACGALFLVLTLVGSGPARSRRYFSAECALTCAMIAFTASSQFGVLPKMERFRAEAGGNMDAAGDASRIGFEKLHKLSEQIEGAVLLSGLGLLLLIAGEDPPQRIRDRE